MTPAHKQPETPESSAGSTSNAAKPHTENQQSIPASEPVAKVKGVEYPDRPGKLGRYKHEPNWLVVFDPPSIISINFASIDKGTYDFSEDFLTKNFQYFKSSLRYDELNGRVVAEGEEKHFSFEDITSQAFGRIFTYLERKTRKGEHYREERCYTTEKVIDLLLAVIAADFLGMVDFEKFEKYIAERLAYALIMNRLDLTPAVLVLVTEHHAFRSMIFWDVCVQAAVRPYLERVLTKWVHWSTIVAHDTGVAAEYNDACFWDEIRDHYLQMRQDCRWYAVAVEQAVEETLDVRKRYADSNFAPFCRLTDPLFDYNKSVSVILPAAAFLANW